MGVLNEKPTAPGMDGPVYDDRELVTEKVKPLIDAANEILDEHGIPHCFAIAYAREEDADHESVRLVTTGTVPSYAGDPLKLMIMASSYGAELIGPGQSPHTGEPVLLFAVTPSPEVQAHLQARTLKEGDAS